MGDNFWIMRINNILQIIINDNKLDSHKTKKLNDKINKFKFKSAIFIQNEEDVGYIIKLNIKNNCIIDRRHTENSIEGLLDSYPDRKCKVYLLHGNMIHSSKWCHFPNVHPPCF